MPSEADFFRAIRNDPDDEGLRLVYADWLEESGDAARAELVRVQCALAPLSTDDPRRWPLVRREVELLADHGARWRQGLPSWPGLRLHFDRGVPGAVTTSFEAFWAHAEELFAAAPVYSAAFTPPFRPDDVARLGGSPHLAQLTSLALSERWGVVSRADLHPLTESPHAARLRALSITGIRLWTEDVEALARSRPLAGLTRLSLDDNRLDPDGVKALAASYLGNLTELSLIRNPIRDDALAALV